MLSPCSWNPFSFSHADVELLPAVSLPWHSSEGAHSLTSREDHHRFEAQVQPNLCTCRWKRFDLLFKEYGDKVAVCTVLGDSDRRWFEISGECSMEGDSKRLIHLGKCELTIQEAQGSPNVGSRLVALLFLERRILGSPLEEVLVGTIQVAKRLLQWNGSNIPKPWVFLLQMRQHSREIVVGQLLPMLEVSSFASRKAPVVDKAAASKRLRKDTLLFGSRVEPILVCSLCFAHCLLSV